MNIQLISVDEATIDQTASIAKNIFIDHYQNIIGLDQATYMVDLFLSKKAITTKIGNGAIFKLVLFENEAVGFSEYEIDHDALFLSKLYVLKSMRGKKIASKLLDDAIEYAKKHNLKRLYLTVNKYNPKTIEIYKHWHFEVVDAVKTPIGNGYIMDDYIMEKYL